MEEAKSGASQLEVLKQNACWLKSGRSSAPPRPGLMNVPAKHEGEIVWDNAQVRKEVQLLVEVAVEQMTIPTLQHSDCKGIISRLVNQCPIGTSSGQSS